MKKFTDEQLYSIYLTIKKDNDYFTKYENVPYLTNIKNWETMDCPRVFCILDFKEWIEKHNIKNINNLGYTSDDPELNFLTYIEKTHLNYPPYDLHTISDICPELFDFFIFSQTLEHLYNPFLAVENIFKIMLPGGYVFTSVPTINIPHMTPIHFGGYNPMGLATMFLSAGFEIIEIGQWGNFNYIQKIFSTHNWPGFKEIQDNGIVTNEEQNVCQCWILVRKPLIHGA
jgi:SAM-dependent methyltransferase